MRNLFAGLAGFCLCVMAGSAQAADRAIIVLDGSGSMWGQIDGKPKLEIARETLKSVLPTLPDDLELGMMAYGHREKGNCQDIELVVPPAAGSRLRETAPCTDFKPPEGALSCYSTDEIHGRGKTAASPIPDRPAIARVRLAEPVCQACHKTERS